MALTAVDASVLIPWLARADYAEAISFDFLLRREQACIAPATATELLSGVAAGYLERELIQAIHWLPILPGYWVRAGCLRSEARKCGRRARLADAFIAQACIDSAVPLLTRDANFQVYRDAGGLQLA